MKSTYSLEYVDEDGDQVVRHLLLTDGEASEFMSEMARRGYRAQLHRLGVPGEASDVSSLPWPRTGTD